MHILYHFIYITPVLCRKTQKTGRNPESLFIPSIIHIVPSQWE